MKKGWKYWVFGCWLWHYYPLKAEFGRNLYKDYTCAYCGHKKEEELP